MTCEWIDPPDRIFKEVPWERVGVNQGRLGGSKFFVNFIEFVVNLQQTPYFVDF